jgi:Transglycosylase SLT domain
MGSTGYGDGVSALRLRERASDSEPISPELVLVCPELRARALEEMQAEPRSGEVERGEPATGRSPSGRAGRVRLRPAVAVLAAVVLSLVAGTWLGATMRSAPTRAVLIAAPEDAGRPPTRVSRRHAAVPAPSRVALAVRPTSETTRRPPAPLRLTAAETEPVVSLLGPLPDPTPARKRLAPTTGRQLLALARARRVDWALLLAYARVHTRGSMQAITLRELKPLARSLAVAEARPASRSPGRRERVLARYYRAVGLDTLISGLSGAKPVLAARILRDPRIAIYHGGREDIAAGRVDVRVLALLLYLARAEGEVSVASLVSGHEAPPGREGSTAHRYGLAVDISALAYTPVRGHQAPGGPVDRALRAIRLLPTEVRPTLVISLLDLGPGSLALADHSAYVDVGYAPATHSSPDTLRALWQSAGARYGIPWQVLAAINKVETDDGRVRGTSSAGAVGWMQFLPSTWRQYGVDANGDGIADPQDPADAIYSAARYLEAAGAATDLPRAIYAYNHAPWYVKRVLAQARSYR